ncbi:MAG: hypothetical protein ACW990_16685, partial [Promethearchaeota archaeon]
IMSLTIMSDIIEFEYNYTSYGLLNTYSEYNNGKEYFTVRLNNFNYQIDDSDPIINILSPQENKNFKFAPDYNLFIIEPNLDKIWYTLDGGLNNITITSLNGTINQTLWNSLPDGLLTIRFYANDTLGYLSYEEVTISKKSGPDPVIIITLTTSIGSAVAVSGTSFYFFYYQKRFKRKTREVSPLLEKDEKIFQSWLGPSAKEILNTISNKKALNSIIDNDKLADKKYDVETTKLTTINVEFLRKIDNIGFNENDKKEFIREMLAFSPKEREEILGNMMSRRLVGSDQFSKEILSDLINNDLLVQILDENISAKKRSQLEKLELTIVSETFLNKVDALGLKGDTKIKFINEMLALSPKEREEIINNILDKNETYG